MKKILFITSGLIALVVAALLVVPGQINWNNYKDDITSRIREATGRDVVIKGDLKIALLPTPTLFARDVRLANPSGASSPNMAHLQVLEVRVALAPLFGGNVQVETIKLIDPIIALEILPDGRGNWTSFDSPEEATPQTPSSGTPEMAAGGLQLDNFVVQNGTFLYRDTMAGIDESIEGVNATVSARSLTGPFKAEGSLLAGGIPIVFEASVGRIVPDKAIPLDFKLGIDQTDIKLGLSGTLQGLGDKPMFRGKLSADGSGSDLASMLGTERMLPGALAQTLSLEGSLVASADGAKSEDFLIRFDGAEAKGVLDLWRGGDTDKPSLNLDMNLARVDMDRWLAKKAIKVQPFTPKQAVKISVTSEGRNLVAIPDKKTGAVDASSAQTKPAAFSMPDGFTASVNLGVDTVTYRGGVVSQGRINAELANGEITISQISALLPGVTNVAAFGFIVDDKGQPAFDGEVEISSSDARGLMRWLQVPDGGIPNERLRAFQYRSKVRAAGDDIQIRGLSLAFDASRLTGGVTVALRKRMAFGADLVLDQINLDQYLDSGDAGGNGAASPTQGASQSTGDMGAMSSISALGVFDTNLKTTIGAMTLKGVQFKKIDLDGTLYNGELTVRNLGIGDVAGSSAHFSGGFTGLNSLPEMKAVKFDIEAKEPSRLMRLAETDAPAILSRVGPVRFSGTADGSFFRPKVDASLQAAGGEAILKGDFSFLPLTSPFEGRMSLRHGNINQLLEIVGAGYRPSEKLGGLDVAATVALAPDQVTLSAIHGQIGPVSVEGLTTLDLAGERPKIRADLRTGIIPVKAFLPPGDKLSKPSQTGGAGAAPAAALPSPTSQTARTRPVSSRWSVDPIDFSGLRSADADITLAAKGVTFDTYSMDNASLHGTLNAGVLTINRLAGDFFGGPVTGSALIDGAARVPRLQGLLHLTNMDVGKAVKTVSGKDLAAGRMAVNLDVTSRGASVADMVSTLGGGGDFAISDLDVRQGGTGTVLSGVIGLFAGLNGVISGILPQKKSAKNLADISSRFTMKDGTADLSELAFKSPAGNGRAKGIVDIAGWWVDVKGEISLPDSLITNILTQNISRKPLPFSVKGDLEGPKITLETASLGSGIGDVLKKTGIGNILGTESAPSGTSGSVPPTQLPPGQDPGPVKIKPEDVLKNILKGVFQ